MLSDVNSLFTIPKVNVINALRDYTATLEAWHNARSTIIDACAILAPEFQIYDNIFDLI